MSTAVTDGIRVEVESRYLPDHSEPGAHRWIFAYTVTLLNLGPAPAKLVSRHWDIDDADGHHEEVDGEGVVGHQPRVEPGEGFRYSSFCVLKTPHGAMRGSYRMVRDDGAAFDAAIAPFALVPPQSLN